MMMTTNKKGKFSERINHRLHLLNLINGCMEAAYEKYGSDTKSQAYIKDLDAFASSMSKTLSETIETIYNSFPHKAKKINLSTHQEYMSLALAVEAVHMAIYKVLPDDKNNQKPQ